MPKLWAGKKLHLWLAFLARVNPLSSHEFRAPSSGSRRGSPDKRGRTAWSVTHYEVLVARSRRHSATISHSATTTRAARPPRPPAAARAPALIQPSHRQI